MNSPSLRRSSFAAFLSPVLLLGLAACDVDQVEEGRLPDVDVDVDSGKLPAYDVDWADVDVGTTTETITVPQLRVVMEEETVEVPFVDVDMPDDADDAKRVRRTIRASAQVPGDGYDIEIQSIYARDGELLVISRLTGSGSDGDKQIVSDNVVLNAPDMEVRHVVVGDRPTGAYNEQYRYVSSVDDLDVELKKAHRIYKR